MQEILMPILGSEEKVDNFLQIQAKYHAEASKGSKYAIRARRKIRKLLFSLRRKLLLEIPLDDSLTENGLKEWFENQFDRNRQQNWETFTFTWDLSPTDPFKIIEKHEWVKAGGTFDEDGIRTPPAFTEQEV